MPTSEISYTASNTDLQAIDTFDLPTVLSATYTIHTFAPNDKSITSLNVIHNGSNTADSQHGTSLSGNDVILITTGINDYVGQVLVQPVQVPTTFKIFKNELSCNLYSENTISGGLIKTTEGFAVDYTAAVDSITVRQSNNNFFGSPAEFITSTILGPVSTLDEKLSSSWSSNNGSELSSNTTHSIASSSGQINNCLFQEIPVTPGKLYRLSGLAFHVYEDTPLAKQISYQSTGAPFVRVGDSLGSTEYLNYQTTDTETEFAVSFVATGTSVFVTFGYGEILSKCAVKDLSLKSSVPFHTFDEDIGTFYLNWNAVAVQTTLFQLSTFAVIVDSSNSIIISNNSTNVNCGSQSAVNKLAFSYANGEVISSHNGSLQSNAFIMPTNIDHATLNASTLQFAYMPEVLANTDLTELSNV